MEYRFVMLDKAVSCQECGKDTLVVFAGQVCSSCVPVWARADQHAHRVAPKYVVIKPPSGPHVSTEDKFKAAPKSELEDLPEAGKQY